MRRAASCRRASRSSVATSAVEHGSVDHDPGRIRLSHRQWDRSRPRNSSSATFFAGDWLIDRSGGSGRKGSGGGQAGATRPCDRARDRPRRHPGVVRPRPDRARRQGHGERRVPRRGLPLEPAGGGGGDERAAAIGLDARPCAGPLAPGHGSSAGSSALAGYALLDDGVADGRSPSCSPSQPARS